MPDMVARALAKAYESFLLATVSMAFDMVSTKFAALSSCCRTPLYTKKMLSLKLISVKKFLLDLAYNKLYLSYAT